MKRKVPLFIGLLFATVISAVMLPQRSPQPDAAKAPGAPAEFKTVKSIVLGVFGRLAPSSPQASAIEEIPTTAEAAPKQLRVPAVRDGHRYGWIQLPRGTPVDLIRVEGENVLIRYDESVVRMPQSELREGSVVLRDRKPAILKI